MTPHEQPPQPLPGEERQVFQLYACCLPVRGARRSLICDLQRETYRFIPNGLFEILTEHGGETVAEIKAHYEHEYDAEIDQYFAFLVAQELGFFTGEPHRFPPLDLAWDPPERITNAIVDSDAASAHDFARILGELDDLGCKALELRFFSPRSLAELRAAIAPACRGRLRSLDIVAAHTAELDDDAALAEFAVAERRINSLLIHSSPKARELEVGQGVRVSFIAQAIDSPACCGQVHHRYFVANLGTFSEARRHNSCLNRKIAVDARGEIRNCPSLPRSFGNVRDASLHAALAHRDFAALWSINKDQIEICKDCEFRYICIDCRAYLSDAKDIYSKPAKCFYDPYTAEWRQPAGQPGTAPAAESAPEGPAASAAGKE